jgi:hypothetical protein
MDYRAAGLGRVFGLAAFVLAAGLPASSAQADWIRNSSCMGNWGGVTCTTHWRKTFNNNPYVIYSVAPASEEEERAAEARDRKWLARCKPVIRQDHYGVSRYIYAAPGCEFGKSED